MPSIGDWTMFLLRWFHFLAGITWIGMLYYFNFVQTPFFATAEAPVRSGMIVGSLVGRALWWFRWGAMLTFITGWLYILYIAFHRFGGLQPFFSVPYGWSIFIGVIWPAQQVIIASATQVSKGGQAIPEAAARGARAGVASRTNTLLSVPMLFFMGAASHFAFYTPTARGAKVTMLVVLFAIMAIVEWNALSTKQWAGKKMLTTVKGTLWGGFVLSAVFFVALKLIFA